MTARDDRPGARRSQRAPPPVVYFSEVKPKSIPS
jgi:hypothetical protein